MVQLTESLVASLDEAAAKRGVSRSALIRDLVADGLREAERDAVGLQVAEGYRRVPQIEPDQWGDPSRFADEATEEVLQRLEEEERAAGHDPW